jgi:esterase/lipase
MTNLYDLSPLPKIVFFHGLNNNPESFAPFITHFKEMGFKTELIILPGHGENRHEAKSLDEALKTFNNSMKSLENTPYIAIAFSQGALYLQLWLQNNKHHRPLKQVLLAPALAIYRHEIIRMLLKVLPSSFIIKSFSPKKFRRYEILRASEYNILIQGIDSYSPNPSGFEIPTLVMVDPKDELIKVRKLRAMLNDITLVERPYLNKGIGCHHIIFHPDYYRKEDWKKFTRKIETFLEINAEV